MLNLNYFSVFRRSLFWEQFVIRVTLSLQKLVKEMLLDNSLVSQTLQVKISHLLVLLVGGSCALVDFKFVSHCSIL